MSETSTVQRAHASGVSCSISMLTVDLDLVPVRRPNLSKELSTTYTCPEHEGPVRVLQWYICADGHQHRENELGRAWIGTDDDGEKMVAITPDEYDLVRNGDFEKKTIDFHVHPIADIEAATIGDDTAYRCRPPRKSGTKQAEIYALLLALASDKQYALVAELRIDSRKLYRLRSHRGQLLLQSLVYPQDLAVTDDIAPATVNKALLAQGKTLLESMCEPFVPDAYGHDAKSAMAKLVADREATPVTPGPSVTADAGAPLDLMAKLEASLAQTKAVKPSRTPRKSAPRTRKAAAAKQKAS